MLWPAAGAIAQAGYPSRPIRMIVPYTAGGLADTMARIVAGHLSSRLGQPAIIDNKPGANEAIGGELTAKSPPDGYTLLMTGIGSVFNGILRKNLPYDALRDFAPISPLISTPFFLVVHPSVPATSVKELIALAKADPGKLTFASVGTASPHHLAGELFKQKVGVDILHVPYKGSGPATADVVSGQVSMMFQGGTSVFPHVRSGKLRLLASTGTARSETNRDLPTMMESGIPDFEAAPWMALFTTGGVPRPIIDRLNREVTELLRMPATREKMSAFGADVTPGTPEELGEKMRAETKFWTKVIREARIQGE